MFEPVAAIQPTSLVGGAPAEASAEGQAVSQPQGTAPEAKPEGGTKPEAEAKPVSYSLKLPEGSLLDAKSVEAITSFAKERKLSNEDAQAVLERESNALAQFKSVQEEQAKTQVSNWIQSVKDDKEYGGEFLGENMEFAKRAVEKFFSAEFKNILNKTGMGNHPELFKGMVRIGKQMKEDTLVTPGQQAGGKKSHEDVLYGSKE